MKMFNASGMSVRTGGLNEMGEFSALERVEQNSEIVTNLTQEYRGRETIWRKVAPPTPVPKRNFTWYTFGKEAFANTRNMARKVMGEAAKMVRRSAEPQAGLSVDYWLATGHFQEETEEAGSVTQMLVNDRAHTEFLNDLADGWHEIDVAETVMDEDNFDSSHKLDLSGEGSIQWDASGGNPVMDIVNYIKSALVKPNKMVVSRDVFYSMRAHPVFRNMIPDDSVDRMITAQQLREYWDSEGIKEVLVGDCPVVNEDESTGNAWGDGKCLVFYSPTAANNLIIRPSFAYTAIVNSYPKTDIFNQIEIAGHVVRLWESYKPLLTGPDAGFLFYNCLEGEGE